MKKPNQKFFASQRRLLKTKIKKLTRDLEKITPKKKRSKSYGRTKGLAFEREVVNKIKHIFPDARRQLEFQVQDAQGCDIQGTGAFRIQCKKYADYVPVSTINEIQIPPDDWQGLVPVLVTAGTNKPAMAVLRLDDLIELIEITQKF